MDTLTHEELDAIAEINDRGWVPRKRIDDLIAAVRSSIPLPIAEAPRDGTVVERCPHCGYTEEDKRFYMDHHLCDAKNARGPIPKGGAS